MEQRICQNCKSNFVIADDDFGFYEKIEVPPPKLCPRCRTVRRMVFWNERNLYRKKEALRPGSGQAGEEIFSTFPEHAPIPIYEHTYWWSDNWDPMSYGRDYDFSRPFFDQFKDLMRVVPAPSREIKTLVNSDYSNNSSSLKNCYLCFDSDYNENCMYSTFFRHSKDSIDVMNAANLERCYELFDANRCYQCMFSRGLNNCRDIWFSRDCEDCDHCFGCANLRHKKYCFFNEQLTREEYERRVSELSVGSYASIVRTGDAVRAFWKKFPYRFMNGTQNMNVTGDYIANCKDVVDSFETYNSQRVRYSQRIVNGTSEAWDCTSWGDNSELIYETVVCGENNRNIHFCAFCWPGCRDMEYSMGCHSSSNLFGCYGLRKKEFCILNKQYDRESFDKLRTRIIAKMRDDGEYGEFFPASLSPLAYNESVAVDYFPLTKQEAMVRGFAWQDPHAREYNITRNAADLPDTISEVGLEITKEIIGCLQCKRAYRILDRELELYKQLVVPLPRLCHNCRYTQRIRQRNPIELHDRRCDKCGKDIRTSFSPDQPEIVYCETCYQAEVI